MRKLLLIFLGAVLALPANGTLQQSVARSSPAPSALDATKSAAESGDANAQNNLAEFYRHGIFVPKDLKAALYWFEKAASAGQPNAQTTLGWAYMTNDFGLGTNYELAMEWNRKAADQGFGEGSSNVGLLYENGWGVPVSYAEAAKWYRKAIEQHAHSGQAELHLAGLYESGLGVGKNLDTAEALYGIVIKNYGDGEFAEEAKVRLALMRANIQSPEGRPKDGETKADYWRRQQENMWGKKGNKG